MSKKITLGPRPSGLKPGSELPAPGAGDNWVTSRKEGSDEPNRRLTLDIPESLHRAIKASCAGRGSRMRHEIVALLELHYRGQKDEPTAHTSQPAT